MVSLVPLFIVVLFSQNHGHLSVFHLTYHLPTPQKAVSFVRSEIGFPSHLPCLMHGVSATDVFKELQKE